MDQPAILGGPPTRGKGPPSWPNTDPEILEVFQQAGRDGWWGRYHADQSEQLEAYLREFHHIDHVILCGSGNYAVELGLRALKIGPGDEVILADYDYPGNFLSIHAVGATPVLVDIDPANGNLSLDAVREAIGPATRAVLASHLHGGRVPMRALTTLARDKGLLVLEDSAQAPGAIVDGKRAGTWGDAGVLSFGGSKLLTAGRGGALLTSRAEVAQRARNHLLRAGNIVCPLTELQAALLMPQCRRLDDHNERRWHHVQILLASLADVPGVTAFVPPTAETMPGFYKLGFQLDEEAFGLPRALFVAAVRAEGFALDEGFAAAHIARSPKRYRAGSYLSQADRAHRGCVTLHHPILLEPVPNTGGLADALRKIHRHAEMVAASVPS